uniref:Uncharacterized protein n=1 Tax=Chromera velia CCMP2878 TaxID=1169474 RepID=A0A0G4HRZ1_9ALVE|eukprot:Cvel_30823.t1-p1 / transcript=Cvel_30823.t1 / gene=Cvel_30823 / organism=Chromera_velia_CCMP2878 / gene_product=hypothetical protein / transcript_product=hypothetical protein / location=Cvel_scaffold4474:5545-6837(-) / protein_length=431 / sequence_SO=supercontig / SO=protein_coding / is_pseudo=false
MDLSSQAAAAAAAAAAGGFTHPSAASLLPRPPVTFASMDTPRGHADPSTIRSAITAMRTAPERDRERDGDFSLNPPGAFRLSQTFSYISIQQVEKERERAKEQEGRKFNGRGDRVSLVVSGPNGNSRESLTFGSSWRGNVSRSLRHSQLKTHRESVLFGGARLSAVTAPAPPRRDANSAAQRKSRHGKSGHGFFTSYLLRVPLPKAIIGYWRRPQESLISSSRPHSLKFSSTASLPFFNQPAIATSPDDTASSNSRKRRKRRTRPRRMSEFPERVASASASPCAKKGKGCERFSVGEEANGGERQRPPDATTRGVDFRSKLQRKTMSSPRSSASSVLAPTHPNRSAEETRFYPARKRERRRSSKNLFPLVNAPLSMCPSLSGPKKTQPQTEKENRKAKLPMHLSRHASTTTAEPFIPKSMLPTETEEYLTR